MVYLAAACTGSNAAAAAAAAALAAGTEARIYTAIWNKSTKQSKSSALLFEALVAE